MQRIARARTIERGREREFYCLSVHTQRYEKCVIGKCSASRDRSSSYVHRYAVRQLHFRYLENGNETDRRRGYVPGTHVHIQRGRIHVFIRALIKPPFRRRLFIHIFDVRDSCSESGCNRVTCDWAFINVIECALCASFSICFASRLIDVRQIDAHTYTSHIYIHLAMTQR